MSSVAAHVMPRQRIVQALQKALDEHCLVVVTAPPGYGKSTAAREMLAETAKRVILLEAKPSWRNKAHMWNALFQRLEEQGLVDMASFREMGQPRDEATLYQALRLCGKDLACQPTLLVLDDYQYAASPQVDAFVESLAREEIPGLNILLLSREKPGLALERLQAGGQAQVFGPDFLAFTREEARELFAGAGQNAPGQNAPGQHAPGLADPDLADKAWEFSEGWVAALRLCIHSYAENGVLEPVAPVDTLLEENFFSDREKDYRKLLLQLSLLGAFTPAQAALLTGNPEAPRLLRELYDRNAFLSYTPEGDSYSIHNLFRSFLAERLRERSLPECRDIDYEGLYRRAGECCLENREQLRAIGFFAQAGRDADLLRILEIFASPAEDLFILLDPDGLADIIESIPLALRCQGLAGYLGFLHKFMLRADRRRAEAMLEKFLRQGLDHCALSPEQREHARGGIEIIQAARRFNDLRAVCDHYRAAVALLHGGPSRLVDQNLFWTFYCPHSALLYHRKPGAYKEMLDLVREKTGYLERFSDRADAGDQELALAEYHLERGDTGKVPRPLLKAEYRAVEAKQLSALLAVRFTRARMYLAEGRPARAWQEMDSLLPILREKENPLLQREYKLCRGYLACICNRAEDIPVWLLDRDKLPPTGNIQRSAFLLLVRGKVLMHYRQWTRLETFAEETEKRMIALESVFGRLHALLWLAVAATHGDRRGLARPEALFARARDLAGPDHIVTTLAEYGRHLYPLLQRLVNFQPGDKELLALCHRTKKYTRMGAAKKSVLTLREQDILEKAATGASNRDIGRELGLSPGSVANALGRIYAKLGAGSRLEAVRKWYMDEKSQ